MRIIAGNHRGRPLIGPEGKDVTRPIIDRAKTSLFDRLSSAYVIESAQVLDLFCGTGSMGLECLSRGASHVVFIDRDRTAQRCLSENLTALGETSSATSLSLDILSPQLIDRLPSASYSLIFADPPYPMMRDAETCEQMLAQLVRLASVASEGARLMLRTPTDVAVTEMKGWTLWHERTYGGMTIYLYERAENGADTDTDNVAGQVDASDDQPKGASV